MIKVCHVTSAHKSNDTRIFMKECSSLAEHLFDVYIVSCGIDRVENNVKIKGLGTSPKNRLHRIFIFSRKIFNEALKLDCDIYHLHDPELLMYAPILKIKGKKVVFDSHEDVRSQINDKYWIPSPIRKIVGTFYFFYETFVAKRIDAVVCATDHIANTFENRAKKIVVVNNYPILNDIKYENISFNLKDRIICYAGGINTIRGYKQMCDALIGTNVKLLYAGPFDSDIEIINNEQVEYLGILNRQEINKLYSQSRIGMLLYQPAKNHFESQPIKMFEYMAAGLPIICSNFNHWEDIVKKNKCGICVNPTNVKEINSAINDIIDKICLLDEMGKNGRSAVEKYFNWNNEKEKLIDLYENL